MIGTMKPEFSIIIPVTRPASLLEALKGISNQTFDLNRIEVVLVCDDLPIPIPKYTFKVKVEVAKKNHPGIKRNIGATITREDAELISKSLYPVLDKKSIDFLYKKACGDGKFRTMINFLKLAEQISQVENKPISLGLHKEASSLLMK